MLDKGSAARAARRLPNREAALAALYDEIAAKNMFPFWATSTEVAHDEIKPRLPAEKCRRHSVHVARG